MGPAPGPDLATLAATLSAAQWVTIDHRITQIGWGRSPNTTEAALTVAGGRLFAAFSTQDPNLLKNSGALAEAPFKTGGALDLMIGTDPQADPKRQLPVRGDIRLLVYEVSGKPCAKLYRAVVPGTTMPVAFSSPSRTITLDQVEDVSDKIELIGDRTGNYAFSIPLATLGFQPVDGSTIKADVGVLRGNGQQTTQASVLEQQSDGHYCRCAKRS